MNKLIFSVPSFIFRRNIHTTVSMMHKEGKFRQDWWRSKIGNRDIVGFGINGEPNYFDDPAFPFPAIRFKENKSELQVLRLKEAGDWRKLTMEEKRALYRASFCQTFAEFKASTTEWMKIIGLGCMVLSIAIWYYIFIRLFAYDDLPETYTDLDRRAHQLRRMIDAQINPITGLASKWDYEKDEWKSNPGRWYKSIDVWNLWHPMPTLDEIHVPKFEDCKDFPDEEILIHGEEEEVEEEECACRVLGDDPAVCGIDAKEEAKKPPKEPTTYSTGDNPTIKPKFASSYTCIGDEKK